MKKTAFALLFVALSLAAAFGQAPGKTGKATTKNAGVGRSVHPAATWDRPWEGLIGMSQADFHSLGLDGLSSDQGSALFAWMVSNRPGFSCGRIYSASEKSQLQEIHPYLEPGADNDAEFVGELRSRVAATPDVRLAYSDSDSDVIVTVLTVENTLLSNRTIGYTAAVVTSESCAYSAPSGWDKGTVSLRKQTGFFMAADADEASLVSRIASELDVSYFDPIRNEHSQEIKLYQ